MTADLHKPVLIFDGECSFCLRQIQRIKHRDRRAKLEYVPRLTPGLDQRFPRLAEGDFDSGMRLITPEGIIHVGADAVYHVARHLPGWRRLAWLYRVPGLHGLARLAYGWVAARRSSLGPARTDDSCSTPPRAE